MTDPRELKAGDTWAHAGFSSQSVNTEVPTVVGSFVTVLRAEGLLGCGSSGERKQRGIVMNFLGRRSQPRRASSLMCLLDEHTGLRLHEPLTWMLLFFLI